MIKGVICDLDGFLVETWKTEPLPGVLDTLAELRRRGIPVAVATNQAGPLWRVLTKQEQFPAVEAVAERLLTCAQALDLTGKEVGWYVSLADARMLERYSQQVYQDALKSVFYGFLKATKGMPLHIVASDSQDWRKPNIGMLYAARVKWGLQPAEVIYGGDLESDWNASVSAGMRFVERMPDVLPLLESEA